MGIFTWICCSLRQTPKLFKVSASTTTRNRGIGMKRKSTENTDAQNCWNIKSCLLLWGGRLLWSPSETSRARPGCEICSDHTENTTPRAQLCARQQNLYMNTCTTQFGRQPRRVMFLSCPTQLQRSRNAGQDRTCALRTEKQFLYTHCSDVVRRRTAHRIFDVEASLLACLCLCGWWRDGHCLFTLLLFFAHT